ncbi:hypothetical protein RNJ44_02134 [Nakaseomyces bracarensis]|uniref:Uncharacterized protein n=1 Tax=Nakaseomyces bracarensis TaxID=273131 RepID=A0ABR4NMM8_9SACH
MIQYPRVLSKVKITALLFRPGRENRWIVQQTNIRLRAELRERERERERESCV